MPIEPERRFVELSVGEVSLVDSPANEEVFTVIKSFKEDQMADEVKKELEEKEESEVEKKTEGKKTEKKTEEEPKKDEVEKVKIEVEKAANETIEKAMAEVTKLVTDIVKNSSEKTEKKEEAEGKEEKAEDEEDDDKKKKAEKKTDEDATEKTLDNLVEAINKAKRFTPKREAALKQALDALQLIASELAPASTEKAKPELPSGASFGASDLAPITKSIEELTKLIQTSNENVTSVTKALEDRIETVEKIRQPSNSVDGEGDTDKKENVEKGLWSNILS